jgi:hypothetical protein
VPFYLRHGPEKHAHRFLGLPGQIRYDKAVNSVAFQKDRRIVHPWGFLCQ